MLAKVYHNPRCGKSREALTWLESNNVAFEVIKYMDEPLTYDELDALLRTLKLDPMDLVRQNETEWKEYFASSELEDEEVIYAMIEYPKLMQRPIVEKAGKAVIARPADRIQEIL
ncbi:MAG: arsenate reductase (glutaredoxin) [Schleiferiaceae bacterium]|nr:arsenate reductase (glutaredoxin) [Schleiferiaceae bacterium]